MSVFFKEKIKNPLIFFGFVLLFLIILLFIVLLTQKIFDSKMEQSVKLFIQKNYQQEFVYDSPYTKKIQSAVKAKNISPVANGKSKKLNPNNLTKKP